MAMFKKIGRLFTIKTRFEAWLVIYAIALGAVERGRHYLEVYPGFGGWLLAVAGTAGVLGCVVGAGWGGGVFAPRGRPLFFPPAPPPAGGGAGALSRAGGPPFL